MIVGGDPTIVEIRCTHIVKDAMKEARKAKFQPNKVGNGLPFLAESVYNCLVTGECTGIKVHTEDTTDPTVKFALEKVC